MKLAKIFNDALPRKHQKELPELDYTTPPRVREKPPRVTEQHNFNQPTHSTQPTRPDIIQQKPITHQRRTRNNTPTLIQPNGNIETNQTPPL